MARPLAFAQLPSRTLEDPDLKKLLLYAALVHFFIGIITLLLAIFLGATITETILAIWELFCAIVGFSALCVHKSPRLEANQFASFCKIYVKVYLAMTLIAALLGASAFIHGTFVLVRTSMLANFRQPDMSAFSSWFTVLGVSNLVVGLGTAIINSIIFQKLLAYERARLSRSPVGSAALAASPPLCFSVSCSAINDLRTAPPNYEREINAVLPNEPPPSYELATAVPQNDRYLPLPEKNN